MRTLALLTLAFLALVLAACTQATPKPAPTVVPPPTPAPASTATPTPTPDTGPPSALEVLDSATVAMAALESGYVEIEVETNAGGVTNGFHIAGDFQAPDRNHVTMGSGSVGSSVGMGIIEIGDLTYVKYPGIDGWLEIPHPYPLYADLFAFGAFNTDLAASVVAGFEPVSEEELAWERVYYVAGPVSRQGVAYVLDYPEETFSRGEVEYWVGVEDFLVRKLVVRAVSSQGESGVATMKVEMRLSDYGKPVSIQAPDA